MSRTDRVRVSTLVAVDPAAAFEIFTEEADAWWKQGPRYRVDPTRKSVVRFEPRVGGRLVEEYEDGDAFEHGRVRAWEPAARLVFEMGGRDFEPGQRTLVEVRFEAIDGGTRVTSSTAAGTRCRRITRRVTVWRARPSPRSWEPGGPTC